MSGARIALANISLVAAGVAMSAEAGMPPNEREKGRRNEAKTGK